MSHPDYVSGIWQGIRVPLREFDPIGTIQSPTVEADLDGAPGTLIFGNVQEQAGGGVIRLNHEWWRGTRVRPFIGWCKLTGDALDVGWQMYYKIIGNPGDVPGAWQGPFNHTIEYGDQTVDKQLLSSGFPYIELPTIKEGGIVAWRIHRTGNTDAYAGNVRLYTLSFHYRSNKRGTVFERPEL